MRVAWFSAVAALIILFAVGPVPGQSNDLSGTWTGNTEVPNSPDPNQVTLTLKKDGDVYKEVEEDFGYWNSDRAYAPTHWMPLPSNPHTCGGGPSEILRWILDKQ